MIRKKSGQKLTIMKNFFKQSLAITLILGTIIIQGCRKEESEKVPVLSTSEISNITGTTASGGGNITDEGSSTVLNRGVCWSTGTTPTIADNKTTDGAGAGNFSSNLSGLNGATTYYVRAYATNNVGTGYGMAMSFTTLGETPSTTTNSATNINTTSVTLNGSVNAHYLSTVVTFEYGTTTSYGSNITATQSPLTGNSSTNVSADLIGLTAGTIYHFRIKAVNSLGTIYSNDLSFTTLGLIPTATTTSATNEGISSVTLNASVNANYLSTNVFFEYGLSTSYGTSVAASQSPVTGNSNTSVSSNITGLTAGTTYHFRIKAVNSLGTSYGSDLMFNTSITDVDGNIYKTISIGSQIWMKENLKSTKYRNGDVIPNTTDNASWNGLTTGAYCDYSNTSSNSNTYGRLYNFYAVVDSRNLCPIGWHVPTDSEWTTLTTFLGGESVAGGKMKETGILHWNSPNTDATDVYGFSALPGGRRNYDGTFDFIGNWANFWSSTEFSTDLAWRRSISTNSGNIYRNSDWYKKNGFSIRCIKD